jgi:hypothetical protein
MATECTAAEINSRFMSEQSYIQQFVEFLQVRSTIEDTRIFEINDTLRGYRIAKIQTRSYERVRTQEPFSQEEIAALTQSIESVTPSVRQALRNHVKEQTRWLPILTPKGTRFDHQDLLSEWVNHTLQHLSDEPTEEEIEAFRQRSLDEAVQQTDRTEGVTDQVLADVIHDAIDIVMDIKWRAKGGGLQHVLDQFDELKLVARVATADAEINLLRQGFILLMTAFDAAIFDIVRVKFRKDFFKLIGVFGKQEKMSFKRFEDAGSYETLRDELVEDQLKKRYVKDLLLILDHLRIDCFDAGGGECVGDLVELVLRRNVHVHNRGIVDGRYLEQNDQGQPEFNIFNLNVGDLAPIDETYWERANPLCGNCVAKVTSWTES